jgi:hypothetical protein
MNSEKAVTPAKAGVQEKSNCFKILDSGFPAGLPGND